MQITPDTLLSDADIIQHLAALPGGWMLENGVISRAYATGGWKASLMLVNAIGFLCETAWHHPDITLSWGRVQVSLNTHSAGGVTMRDIALAGKIEALATWKPDDGILEGIPPGSGHAILADNK